MPYEIVKSCAGGQTGYRVRKTGTNDYLSKKALSYNKAKAQRTAVIISEAKKKDLKNFKKGGKVKKPIGINPIKGNDYGDVVLSILEPGEIVIPVEKVPKVEKLMKKYNIKL